MFLPASSVGALGRGRPSLLLQTSQLRPGTGARECTGALERQFDNFKAMSFQVKVGSRAQGAAAIIMRIPFTAGQVLDIAAEGFVDAQLGVRRLDQRDRAGPPAP